MLENSLSLFQEKVHQVVFDTKINTESNANLKVTNTLLSKLSLSGLELKYEKDLHKLLFFRNSVAHGNDSIKIEQKHLESFSTTVQNIASDLISLILDGYSKRVYIKST